MAHIQVNEDTLAKLNGKVVIITGGANGIGKTASEMFHSYGAKVVIADLDEASGQALAEKFGQNGIFQAADVTNWHSLVELFERAREHFGSIDCVCANAGMPEKDDFLHEDLVDSEGRLAEPDFKIIDVNVNGVMRTAKLALHYFAKNPTPGGALCITGSAASYFGAAPIVKYGTAKHALLGLTRSLAALVGRSSTRVNLVAPWMTETGFSSEVRQIWGDLPINTIDEVAKALLVACADETLHGRGLFVAKQIVDVEIPMHRIQAEWLGAEISALFDQGRVTLASGMGLPTEHYLE